MTTYTARYLEAHTTYEDTLFESEESKKEEVA